MRALFDIALRAITGGLIDRVAAGKFPLAWQHWLAVPVLGAFAFAGPMAAAQEEAGDEEDDAVEVDEGVETLVVTGSRLRRNTYDSLSPLQITTAEVKREAGLIDPGEILQESASTAGRQIDLTFTGFVLDDGPGAVTANLRGLGAARTLVLIGGRRVGPAGVEGAPVSPDLGILPGLLVQQYDELLDGASSIYGSDAVAGVINVILQKDFDGFSFTTQPSFSNHGAGDSLNFGATWGRNFDRGFVGIGMQYQDDEAVTFDDRPWTAGCNRHVEIDQAGNVRNTGLYYSTRLGMVSDSDECLVSSLAGRVFIPDPYQRRPNAGSIYYTPGYTNGGWPNFSESSQYGFGVDGDGDGRTDVAFRDYSINGRDQFAHYIAPRTTTSVMAYGEYTFEGDANLTPYFEALVARRDFNSDGGAYQLFPDVPARNPFNLCNPEGDGVDCGLANDALFRNPNYLEAFRTRWVGLCAGFGIPREFCTPFAFGLDTGPIGPLETTPIVSVRGDRTITDTRIDWRRYVAGLRGDLPFMNRGSFTDWTFDFSVTATRAAGESSRWGVREDRLNLALGYYSRDWNPCERNLGPAQREARGLEALGADVEAGCVPVNMFAPSLYANIVGDFGTQAERDYVFGNRGFLTEYDQTVFSYYMSGAVAELPAGAVQVGAGVEYRIDDIASKANEVAAEGLLFDFSRDRGAIGDKYTRELFAETEIPIVANRRGATELDLNLSVRWTDDEYYGGAWTGSSKLGWRPIDSLLIRATYGTSYRAPNLRELFLAEQTGFRILTDPCLLPEEAINDITDEYDPSLDRRRPHVLENCRAHGVDPTIASNGGLNRYSVEVAQTGSLELDEETSKSSSVGFSWQQPFTNAFDLRLGMSYYDIEIKDTIIEPHAQLIIFDCYESETSAHTFCERITRESDPERPLLSYIDEQFLNRDQEKVRGVDVNVAFETTLTVFERPLELELEVRGHRVIERSTLQINTVGDLDQQLTHREWGYPEHRGDGRLQLDYDRWRFVWTSRYVGNQDIDIRAYDDWADIGTGRPIDSDTCLGPPDDLLCRDVGFAGNYWVHHGSVSYRADTWSVIAGSRNVFDTWPPQVDGAEVPANNNTPRGFFYDIEGRMFFVGFSYQVGEGG